MKSHDFYLYVLDNEEIGQYGHEFKMFITKNSQDAPQFDEQFELQFVDVMGEYDCQDFRVQPDREQPMDKLKVTFKIHDKNNAIKCYSDFCLNYKKLFDGVVRT